MAVMLGLSLVTTEADVQGQDRRQRVAYFAAEAGLAEGREAARMLLQNTATVTLLPLFSAAGPAINDPVGFPASVPGNEWFQLLPPTSYGLASTGAGGAFASGTASADRERTDSTGASYQGFPANRGVTYQVFLRDDNDDANQLADSNGKAWIISVGEVASSVAGAMPVRAVVRALVSLRGSAPSLQSYTAQQGQGSTKSGSNTSDITAPDVSVSSTLP